MNDLHTPPVFPPCRWGGAIDGDRRPCASPKLIVPRAGVDAATCMNCYCRNHAPVSRRVELPRRGICLHLLAERERRTCASCKGTVEVKVFGCDKHTLCTLGKPMDDLACCATCKDHQTLGPILTFGMASCRNGVETWFTLQGFLALVPPCSFEMLVCDNSPGGDKAVKDAAEECGARYVLADEVSGTAYPRDRVFREARGQIVLCVDSHVLLLPGSIQALLAYYQAPDRAKDMVHGPLLTSDHKGVHWTHWEPAWRDGMFGTAASDHAALKLGEPFAIPLAGCGLMACKKDAWPGFNPAFKSFGSEEGYIQEKVRRNGGRVVCVPGVRWSHKFFHLGGQRTRYDPADLIANYLIGHRELGWDERPLLDHFRARNGPEQIDRARSRAAERQARPVIQGPVVRNLAMHLWPRKEGGAIWRRTVAQLKQRWSVFNGKKVVSVATGPGAEPVEAVKAEFDDPTIQYLEVPNNRRLREVVSFEGLFGAVASHDRSERTFYCHTKGVTRPQNVGVTCHGWGDIQFEVCLDYLNLVEEQLRQFPITGCFKKLGKVFSHSAGCWHYSGTFFWFRHDAVFSKDWRLIDQQWWGMEAWPALHFPPEEAGCLFHAGRVPQLDLYSMAYLSGVVLPELRKLRQARPGRVLPPPAEWAMTTE